MCSIAGIISARRLNETNDLESLLQNMQVLLRHRGPDDSGLHLERFGEETIALANNRLAIIDLSDDGHQPMHDENSGLTITYNGEVYNFRELRGELGNGFGPWRSNTDTEVVLRAYRKWGTGSFARLRGMFAVAIWDAKRGELTLARDPFGIKPLYYSQQVQGERSKVRSPGEEERRTTWDVGHWSNFIFASEVRALLASGQVPRKLDHEAVASYLGYGSVQAPLTIIEGVRSLMPGNFMRVCLEGGSLQIEEGSYLQLQRSDVQSQKSSVQPGTLDFGRWTLNDPEWPRTREEAVATLREKLRNSVRAHLVSDVPLGVFLSGGMDSSALVALMTEVSPERPKTFSVVFEEENFSEAPHSRLLAKQFKTDHHEVRLTENRLLGMLPEAIASLDQPTMDGINTYVVSKAVKDAGITVALSGLGGDELFAGYATFRRALRMQSISSLAKRLLRSASRLRTSTLGGTAQRRKFWQLAASDGSPEAVYDVTRQLFSAEEAARILDCALRTASCESFHPGDKEAAVTNLAMPNPKSEALFDPVNAISLLELQGYMANTLLRDTDCMSMAHSVEVRVPFVDVDVASYVLALPGNWKMNGSNGTRPKPLLADVVSDLLPKAFMARPKMGFTLPFQRWLQSRLRSEISSVLDDETALSRAGLSASEVAIVWSKFLRAPRDIGWSRPWSLYVLARWCEINQIDTN